MREDDEWVFRYRRPAWVTGVTYTVEASTNLVSWDETGLSTALENSAEGMETWTVRHPADGEALFFRLMVTE